MFCIRDLFSPRRQTLCRVPHLNPFQTTQSASSCLSLIANFGKSFTRNRLLLDYFYFIAPYLRPFARDDNTNESVEGFSWFSWFLCSGADAPAPWSICSIMVLYSLFPRKSLLLLWLCLLHNRSHIDRLNYLKLKYILNEVKMVKVIHGNRNYRKIIVAILVWDGRPLWHMNWIYR